MREYRSLPTDEIACWWEETTISTQLRLAAGVCVLTTGLLIGSAGGAIAAADTTDAAGPSASTSEGAGGTDKDVNAPASVASTANKPRTSISSTLQNVLQTLGSLGKPAVKPPVAQKPTTPGDVKPTTPADVKPTTPAVAPDTAANNTGSSELTPAVITTAPAESDVNAGAGNPNPTPLTKSVTGPDPGGPPPSTGRLTPALEGFGPAANALATVAGVTLTLPGVAAALPTSQNPLGEVIASLQIMLGTVNAAVTPLALIPGNLYSLMVAAAASTVEPVDVTSRLGLSATAGAGLTPLTGPFSGPILPISPGGGMPLLFDVIAPATLGGLAAAGLSADLSLSGTAPLAVGGAGPADALSFLEHTVKAVLAPASLTALAAFALPGVAGLLIICAAGMRLGYRQAKAALAVRTSAISRFARQGPLGVVRSGSLVALHTRHPRALRVVRPSASRATPLFEQAA